MSNNNFSIQQAAEKYLLDKSDSNFELLYNRLLPGIRGHIWGFIKHTKDLDLLDELISNTFFKVVLNIEQYSPYRGNFSTWIYAIAKNESLLSLKNKYRYVSLDSINTDNTEFNREVETVDVQMLEGIIDCEYINISNTDVLEEREMKERWVQVVTLINRIISRYLPEHYKHILIDREFNMMKYDDLAEKYEIPINTVKSRIRIGRQLVREFLGNNIQKINKYLDRYPKNNKKEDFNES